MTTKLSRPQAGGPARCGLLTAVSYAPSSKPNYSDEIRIDGQWDGEGVGYFYLPLGAIDAFTDAGVVRYTGVGQDGRPAFSVVNPNQRIMIWRELVPGKNAKPTHVRAVDAQGNMLQLPACQRAVLQNTPAGAPVQTPPTTPATPPVPPLQAPPSQSPPTQPTPPLPPAAAAKTNNAGKRELSEEEIKQRELQRWGELDEHYGACLAFAAYRLREALGSEVGHDVIQAGAATVMIQSERDGLIARPGLAKRLLERLHENGKRLKAERDPGLTEEETRTARAPANAARSTEYDDYPEALDEEDDGLPF